MNASGSSVEPPRPASAAIERADPDKGAYLEVPEGGELVGISAERSADIDEAMGMLPEMFASRSDAVEFCMKEVLDVQGLRAAAMQGLITRERKMCRGSSVNRMSFDEFVEDVGVSLESMAYDMAKRVAADLIESFMLRMMGEIDEGAAPFDRGRTMASISVPVPSADFARRVLR